MSRTKRNILFGLFLLCLLLVHMNVLGRLFDFSMADVTASHLILIPFVSIGLIYRDRQAIFSSVQSAVPAGLGAMLIGVGLFLSARLQQGVSDQNDTLSWMVSAFVVLALGGFLLFYGAKAFQAALFPLLFLGFMIPIPSSLLNGIISILKSGSTEAVAGLFTLTDTPYFREGFVFRLPGVAIEIADECSGIRSSIALLLTSLLAGHLTLRARWTKALLVLSALPIAVLKNGIRITGLSLLAIHADHSFLTGQLHHEGGIVFFLLSLAILAPVLLLLRRSESVQTSRVENFNPAVKAND